MSDERSVLDEFDPMLKRAQDRLARLTRRRLDVEEVRAIMVDPRTAQVLANVYGVGPDTINKIKGRLTWREATKDLEPAHARDLGQWRYIYVKVKLTDEQARKIFLDPREYAAISKSYDVSIPTVRSIKIRRKWRYATLGLGDPPHIIAQQKKARALKRKGAKK